MGRAIELRKTLTGALNPISDGEGNTAGCAPSRVTSWPLCVDISCSLVRSRPLAGLVLVVVVSGFAFDSAVELEHAVDADSQTRCGMETLWGPIADFALLFVAAQFASTAT